MPTRNPDFARFADEVLVPTDLSNMCGWGTGNEDEKDKIRMEQLAFDELENDMPCVFNARDPKPVRPDVWKAWQEFQQSKGRSEGSNDLTLIDEFVLKKNLIWLPQIIGSCVLSNTFRGYVKRMIYEIVILGSPEMYLGKNEFGSDNLSFYGPMSYGLARRRANMRGGDGLYCAPMAESLMKDGVLPCNTPALLSLTQRLNVDGEKDYPEPQSSRVYRAFGNWSYLDDLKQYLAYPVQESVRVTSAEQLWDLLMQGKPCFVCSNEAIRKKGTHRDGFPIHERDPFNRWAHNMCFHGGLVASDGDRFITESNESWPGGPVYIREIAEVQKSFDAGRLTVQSIGEIMGPQPLPQFDF